MTDSYNTYKSFIISYVAGNLPSLNNIKFEKDKKTLQDHVEICYDEALKKWFAGSNVRERIALKKFPDTEQLKKLFGSEEWDKYSFVFKSLAEQWIEEFRNEEECAENILKLNMPDVDEHAEQLIKLLKKDNVSETPTYKARGRINHEQVDGYIQRYCTSDQSESNFVLYGLGTKERTILADYVVGLEGAPAKKYILYSSAQTGKTTELQQLCWELQHSGFYFPISFEVRRNTRLKRENLPDYQFIGDKEVVVVIDALDEVNGVIYENLLEEIGGYAYDHPEMKVVLSCRSNFRREKQLELFKELFLEELSGEDAQSHIFNKLGRTKGKRLTSFINKNQLAEFAKNPFFLTVLIDAYDEDYRRMPRTKAEIYKLFIERSYKKEKNDKGYTVAISHTFEESVILLERVALGMSLMNAQSLNMDELRLCLKNDDRSIEECLRFDLIRKEDDDCYSFKHNAFREWLVAHYLSREGLGKAKELATHPNGRIKPEWYNIIMLWVTMYGKDKKEEIDGILDWLKAASLDLVIYLDRDMLDENTRNSVFKGLMLEYKSLGIRMSNIMMQDYKNLLSFGQSDETIEFLADEVQNAEIGTAYYADLMCLCYFLEWELWARNKKPLTEKLFDALEVKTKEALIQETSHDLSFLYFDNEYFTKDEYLNRIYAIVKDSNHYEAIKSMIRLIDMSNKVDDYIDYILDKEGYVHNQKEGITTCIVSRICVFTALIKVRSIEAVKKVLSHHFYNSHYAYYDEQEEYSKMMSSVLNSVSKYIKSGDTELADMLENYYLQLFKDYHYHFDHDQQSQDFLIKIRKCYKEAGLTERGKKTFYNKLALLFSPQSEGESKWDTIRETFTLAALWMTTEDVENDFSHFSPSDGYDWTKAGWYREIPYGEVAECASKLYHEIYPEPTSITKGRERRRKSFDDFANYATFKQIILEMAAGLDEHTTRKEYSKRLRELEEGYNLYAFRFFLHYPLDDDRYNIDGIIKGIKNKDIYDAFFMKEIVGMMEHPDPELTITDEIKKRCYDTAKIIVIRLCDGKGPVCFYQEALGEMLKSNFEIPTEKLPNLLDLGYIKISRKDDDGYYSREYSVFKYLTEKVDEETLAPLVIQRLRANISKEGYRLSYDYSQYLVENSIEEGYSLALEFAQSGFYLAGNIMELLIKNGIRIEEIKAGVKSMSVSDRLFCYYSLARNAGQDKWAKERLEAEYKSFEGYDLKRAIQQLISMGSMDALDYLASHTDIIRDGDDYHFNYDNPNAVPALCLFIEYYDEHKMDAHFMLNSIITSLERIATSSKDSLIEVKQYLNILTQKGQHFKYLNRYVIAFEDKFYANSNGISDICEAMKLVDEKQPEDVVVTDGDSVYISYSWASSSMGTVEYLCSVLTDNKISFKRDKKDCNYTDSIKDFMDAIRAGKIVIVIFSRPYLKSKNCMYELSGILDDPSYVKRILPVVVDSDIREAGFYKDLCNYWYEQKELQAQQVKDLNDLDPFLAEPEVEKLKEIENIYKLLPTLKKYIDWTNTENLNNMCATKFSSIIRKIRERSNHKE